jgi:outer membrane lipoprotein carrier protein
MKLLFLLFITTFSFSFELKYKTFSADFNQSVESNKKVINYTGKVFVKNSLIFWDYKTPIEKKIWVTNFNKIYIYEPDLEQVTIYKNSSSKDFFQLLTTATQIDDNLYKKQFDKKEIFFKTQNGMVKKIYYKDKIDNLVTLNFKNIEKKEFNNSLFLPSFPKDVDIIYAK